MTRESTYASDHGWTTRRIDLGEVRLHLVEAGPEEGPLVVLLHGFPELWWSWRFQIPALVAAGYRVAAPDLRGYDRSDAPDEVAAYGMDHLVGDVAALISTLGRERAHLVGHDWGGAIAWATAEQRPDLVDRLAILNCPHPADLLRALRRPAQLRKSWYMLALQLPFLPERLLLARDGALLRRLFAHMSPADAQEYVEAAQRTRTFHGPIHYYRAALRAAALGTVPKAAPIAAETLVVWGQDDPVFARDLADPSPRHVPKVRVERIEGAGHSVQLDAADRVNPLLVEHFRR